LTKPTEVEVTKALIKGAMAAIALTSQAALPISVPGRTFAPDIQKFWEIVPLLNGASATYWDANETFQGSLRVILHWPNDDSGVYTQMSYLAELKAHLLKGTYLINGPAKVLISDHPNIGSPILNGQETLFPLTIRYQCYASP